MVHQLLLCSSDILVLPLLPRDPKVLDIHEAKVSTPKDETLEMLDTMTEWIMNASYRAQFQSRWIYFIKSFIVTVFPRLCKKFGFLAPDSGTQV